jgi:hypothetical protein
MPQDEDEVLAAFAVSRRGGPSPMDRRRGGLSSRSVVDSSTSVTSLGEAQGMSNLSFEDEGGISGKEDGQVESRTRKLFRSPSTNSLKMICGCSIGSGGLICIKLKTDCGVKHRSRDGVRSVLLPDRLYVNNKVKTQSSRILLLTSSLYHLLSTQTGWQ